MSKRVRRRRQSGRSGWRPHAGHLLHEPDVDVFVAEPGQHARGGLVVADDTGERGRATETRHRDRCVRRQPPANDVVTL
jgi:hypothetical protein